MAYFCSAPVAGFYIAVDNGLAKGHLGQFSM